jgi:glyoxylase-like metal-dependent hydrolase (beta-lactamase superfamily II)
VLAKIMTGFKRTFGEDALDRFGVMLPVAQERFLSIQDGQSIPLGKRELRAIHTPGHDPYHLCFYDAISKGLFCGDVMGGYIAEIDLVIPPLFAGTDFSLVLKSLEKLREINPAKLFFSHGCTIGDVEKNIQATEDNIRNGQNIVHKALLAGEDREKIAYRLIDTYPKFSDLVKSQMSNPKYIQRALRWVDAYSWYLKKMKMI